jgi:hypothetical protein
MSLWVEEVQGSNVMVNGVAIGVANPQESRTGGDWVSLVGDSTAFVRDGTATGPVAAIVTTSQNAPSPSVQTFSSYVYSMYQVYYNRSYRWQVTCPGGSIGIRI